jgi:S1-C subfamily serine protease
LVGIRPRVFDASCTRSNERGNLADRLIRRCPAASYRSDMSDTFSSLSNGLADAVERAAGAIVQVHGQRRPAAGVVFASDLILAPAHVLENEGATVRLATGATHEGAVLGRAFSTGLAVIRVKDLGATPLEAAPEPRVGHLALAVGRTYSGGVMATLTNVAVVGGPLRTGRASQLERVIRIAQSPHGALTGGALIDGSGRALGVITGTDIRRTTVVIPAALAWSIGDQIVRQGGTKQGFLGVSSTTVALPERQRGGRTQTHGLLVTGVVPGGPADAAGLLVGDVIVALDSRLVEEPEALVMLLRADRDGPASTLTVLRGGELRDVGVTIGERPVRESSRRQR